MKVVGTTVVCDGARAQISRDLDGELSDFERRMLAVHVDRCPDCRAFAAGVAGFTHDLRTAPLEQLDHPVVLNRPRRSALSHLRVGIVAALAVATVGSVLQVATTGTERSFGASVRTPTKFETSSQVGREVQQIIADGDAFNRHSQGGGELAG